MWQHTTLNPGQERVEIERDDVKFVAEVTLSGGIVRITKLTVEGSDITATDMQTFPIAQLREEAARLMRATLGDPKAVGRLAHINPYDDGFYREVALAYLSMLATDPSRPAKALADRLRRTKRWKDLKLTTVHGWVHRARRDGWLGPAEHGRAGASPGPKLIEEGETEE